MQNHGTWRWLCVEFSSSETGLRALDTTTLHVRRQVLEATFDEPNNPDGPLKFGECPLQHFNSKAVRVQRDRKKGLPEAANVRIKAIRRVFKWAIDEEVGGITENPARDVSRFRSKRPGGHHTWTIQEIEQFEKRHTLGSRRVTLARLHLARRLRSAVRSAAISASRSAIALRARAWRWARNTAITALFVRYMWSGFQRRFRLQ